MSSITGGVARAPRTPSYDRVAAGGRLNPRLVNLLASFIRASSEYALERLGFAVDHPEGEPPPLLARLPDASEATLRAHWSDVEAQIDAATRWVKRYEAELGKGVRPDPAFTRMRRLVRELDQYARALRWFLSVTGGETH